MCFRCLIFSLSGPCELLFLLCFLDLRSGECNVVSFYVLCSPVNGSVCFVCCVFVNCLLKQFAICLGVFVILLLNVMELFTLLILFLCVILHTMSSGKNLQLLCIFPCENSIGSVYIDGYGGLSESGLCVFRELCPVSFLVVDECPSVCCSL